MNFNPRKKNQLVPVSFKLSTICNADPHELFPYLNSTGLVHKQEPGKSLLLAMGRECMRAAKAMKRRVLR